MSNEVELAVDLVSVRRLLFRHRFGKIIAAVSGEASLKFVPPTSADKDALGRELGDGIAEVLFGRKTVSLSGDSIQVAVAGDILKIELSKENIVSLSVEVPIEIAEFDLSTIAVKQDVKGNASVSAILSLEFIPDYRRLANRQSRKAVQEILRKQSHKAVRLVQRGRRFGKVMLQYGRRALYAPFRKLADSLARNLARNAIKLGSQTAALRKLMRGLGKLAAAGAVVLDAYLIAQEQVPIQAVRHGNKIRDLMHPTWANAYAELLAGMTAPEWASARDRFFEMEITVQRLAGPVPDIWSVYRRLADAGESTRPAQDVAAWRDEVVKRGSSVVRRKRPLAEIDWVDLYREAFNVYFVFADAAAHASGSRLRARAWQMARHAHYLTSLAGVVAAYHDIANFVYASGVYADAANVIDPNTVWDDWSAIVALHQAYYGREYQDRVSWYVHVTSKALDVRVLPFSDFPATVATP